MRDTGSGTAVVRATFRAAAAALVTLIAASLMQAGALAVVVTPQTVTLLAAGDMMCHSGQLSAAQTSRGYVFTPAFAPAAATIKAADLAVANLETTLRPGGYSGYPQFRSPVSYADALKAAGFDVLTTANNHSLDGGATGVRYTASYLDRIGVARAGTNNKRWVVVKAKGVRIAFLPYTYATNGISSPFAGAVSRISLPEIRRDIAAARKYADFVVVYLHWGTEYVMTPEASSRTLAHGIIDSGADLILGSHPHVVRPVEFYRGHYIVHSMGNFVSGQVHAYTDLGVMARITITKNGLGTRAGKVEIIPVYRDRSNGRGTSTYRGVEIDKEIAAPDRLISSSDRSAMLSYRALCKRMYRGYY